EFAESKMRQTIYRPFTKTELFFDKILIDRPSLSAFIFPTPETESENRVICVPSKGGRTDFWCYLANVIPNLTITSIDGTQCFSFYTYDEDGANRQENITDWALSEFRTHYNDDTITKWDIFHYTYGLLHHPDYRQKYEANLKRDLPHIPFTQDFRGFADAGAHLANLHVTYESQPEYDLKFVQTPEVPLDWRVEKMKLSKDKTQIVYNKFLTLDGIPPKAFDYRLGNRSALEWIIDQYRIKTDKRSGIVNDPNRADDPQYIVKLIGKVITVSLETVDIISNLPTL
ncbi:DNA helicase, partial [Candidatus Poribacteria bacterium]|nr:DNA helicase [Candidatus Poribacteria bacterium]